MPSSGPDYLDCDSLFTEEQRLVRDTVRSWVEEKVMPIIEDAAYEGRFPMELVPEMGAMHLFGATLSEYGLPGLDNVAYGLIMQELERGDSGLRSFVSVQSALVMYPIFTHGSQEQKDRWIPRLASASAIGCFGLTEPDFGSNPGGMRTTAKKDGDSYVLNGAKGLDHERFRGRRRRCMGQARRRDPRLPRRARDQGFFDLRAQGQDVAACIGDVAARV